MSRTDKRLDSLVERSRTMTKLAKEVEKLRQANIEMLGALQKIESHGWPAHDANTKVFFSCLKNIEGIARRAIEKAKGEKK